ncbi:MAG: SDR family NAD(P)-dependent oxidoreductase [Clostridiales bacterium]|nr:SDR family NAD(P)-dependent oxidoreductase [Clostridiales bacterium]
MKYAIVTGAYGGMGKSAVDKFCSNGFTVFALDKKVESPKPNVIPILADVTNKESLDLAFEQIKKVTDNVFAVVHFAGVYALDSLVEMSEEEFDRVFKINLYGAFNVNKTFLPLLSKGSRIIMVTSELAPLDPLPFTGIYAVSKRALDAYAYSLKMELQLLGIFVSVIRAGAVKTDMLGVSTTALDKFCEKTELYKVNSKRFKKIVESVEAKCVSPEKIAKKTLKIANSKKPKFAYSLNRNKLLLLLNALPKSLQFKIIKTILK